MSNPSKTIIDIDDVLRHHIGEYLDGGQITYLNFADRSSSATAEICRSKSGDFCPECPDRSFCPIAIGKER